MKDHHPSHSHSHHHHHDGTSSLKFAFFINLVFSLVEVYGGFFTNSVSILSDALHDFGDSLALGLAWYLETYSLKKKDAKYSYGYRRFSLLSAVINVAILSAGSVYLFIEAIKRLSSPEEVNPLGMLAFAVLGVAVNGVSAWRVSKHHSHNHRAAFWHLLEDLLGWCAVLIAAVLIYFTHVTWLDPILSCAINVFVLFNVLRRLREMLRIFLQGVPATIDLDEIQSLIKKMPLVSDVHALQAWSMDGDHHFLNCHVLIKDEASKEDLVQLKGSIKAELLKHNVNESSIEFEFESEVCATNDTSKHSH
jgi:cobalt-zinc-cadmium efflux system protein